MYPRQSVQLTSHPEISFITIKIVSTFLPLWSQVICTCMSVNFNEQINSFLESEFYEIVLINSLSLHTHTHTETSPRRVTGWYRTPCSFFVSCRLFWLSRCIQIDNQFQKWTFLANLKMEAASLSERSINNYRPTYCYMAEEGFDCALQ
jgi:hypothetical protein